MKKILVSLVLGLVGLFAFTVPAFASTPVAFFNGFETDINGWFTPTRVASGTDGITSAAGSWHAKATADYTIYNGYTDTFPLGGFETSLDIYLDMSKNPTVGTDVRFDYTSAISEPSGNHRRDFIFNVGTDPSVAGQFVMSASNNAPGWPSNPGRDPFTIGQSGWYTFRHTFQNNGSGVLQVVMDVLDHSGNVLHSWTLSDPSDVIGTTVGGNRYSWFASDGFPYLAIDNSQLNLGEVAICHLEKKSSTNYHLITVDADSVAAHLKHGDQLPGVNFKEDCSGNLLTGPWRLGVNNDAYVHDMFIDTLSTSGAITGHGGYPANSGWIYPNYPYPYNWTMTGTLSGNTITMIITYQDNVYTSTITGTINSSWNSMSGTGTSGVISWTATR